MALEGITPSEIRQEKNKSCMISLTESKTKQNKKKQAHGQLRTDGWLPEAEGGGGRSE